MKTLELLRQEILETIANLKEFGAEVDTNDFYSLSAKNTDDDNDDLEDNAESLNILKDSVDNLRGQQVTQNRRQNRAAAKPKDIEPAPILDDDLDEEEEELAPKPVAANTQTKLERIKALKNKISKKASGVKEATIPQKKAEPEISDDYSDDDYVESDLDQENADGQDYDDTDVDEEDEQERLAEQQAIDSRKIDDNDDTDMTDNEVSMPLTVNSRLSPTVKILAVVDVEEYYALLLQLRLKLDALELFDSEEDPLVLKLLKRTYTAYTAASEKLESIAEEGFPARLNRFGESAKETLISELTSIDTDTGKKNYRFDTKNAAFSRFVRIEDATVVYYYIIKLRSVVDDNEFVFQEYNVIVSQKLVLTKEDQERGVPPRPRYYITRTLRDSPDFNLGIEFTTNADMQVRVKKILAFDSLRTELEKINIPFSEQELSQKFLSSHVKKVMVDDEEHKIVVLLKAGTTTEQINLVIPDFMRSLGGIVNLKKLAVKYQVDVTVPSVSFVIIHKTKDKSVINRSVLMDMKERYDMTDEAFRSLVKALTVGN